MITLEEILNTFCCFLSIALHKIITHQLFKINEKKSSSCLTTLSFVIKVSSTRKIAKCCFCFVQSTNTHKQDHNNYCLFLHFSENLIIVSISSKFA